MDERIKPLGGKRVRPRRSEASRILEGVYGFGGHVASSGV